MNIQIILQYIIILQLIGGLSIWIYWYIKNKEKHNYAISPILFLLHASLFSILASINFIEKDIYIIWRDLIFIHALTIFISIGIILIKITGGKK
jgi:hypothetical protein